MTYEEPDTVFTRYGPEDDPFKADFLDKDDKDPDGDGSGVLA